MGYYRARQLTQIQDNSKNKGKGSQNIKGKNVGRKKRLHTFCLLTCTKWKCCKEEKKIKILCFQEISPEYAEFIPLPPTS
jgi:hypothetical protein